MPFSGDYRSSEISRDYTLQQTFEIGGKRKLRTQSASATYESQKEQYRAQELDLLRQAKEAYYSYAAATEKLNYALETLTFQQRFLSHVQDDFQTAQALLADLTRAKLETSRAYNDVFVGRQAVDDGASGIAET